MIVLKFFLSSNQLNHYVWKINSIFLLLKYFSDFLICDLQILGWIFYGKWFLRDIVLWFLYKFFYFCFPWSVNKFIDLQCRKFLQYGHINCFTLMLHYCACLHADQMKSSSGKQMIFPTWTTIMSYRNILCKTSHILIHSFVTVTT